MKIVMANDHGALELSERIREYLESHSVFVTYLGTCEENSVDYPDMAEKAVNEFRKGGYDFGILLCGTGIGISIAANKMRGIRCALAHDTYSAAMARAHNNSNFIAFGGRVSYIDDPILILDRFLNTSFEGGRHERRVNKIMALEGK